MDLVNDSPRVLGNRYEVGELLGRGGMAEVHLGRDARLGRTVAIKLLRSDLARDSTFQARFRREAQSSAALNHPAIAAVYDTGEEQVVESGGGVFNLPYIVMEHIEGRTLRDVLAEGHHLDVDAALDIIAGVLTALEYSHRIGIVHRDIKPANVMLTPVGDVKVMDFGIARAMSDSSSTMTQTQAVIGTAQYLSPEQARGEQVDTRSDLYSAGCLLYELLTGRPPFVADSPVAVAYQHVREQPIPPSRVIDGIPNSVDRIVLHSLAKGRDERYQTAADFRADVEAARGGRQVGAAVPVMHGSNATTQYVPMQDPSGTRVAPAAGMAGGALLGGQTMAGQGAPGDPYNQNPDYQNNDYQNNNNDYGRRDQQQSSNWKTIVAGIAVVVIVAVVGFLVAQQLGKNGGGDNTAKTAKVLNVVDKIPSKAEDLLRAQGFTDISTVKAKSSVEKTGRVTKQDPEADTVVALTTKIVLTVGNGPGTVEVPDVRGLTRAQAKQKLEGAGFTVGDVRTEDSTTQDINRVTRTDPKNGEFVEPKSSIIVYIASGEVKVKNVEGKTEAQAKAILEKQGFEVTVKTEPNEAEAGTVLGSDPEAGSTAKQGSTVTIFVSEGPGEVEPTEPVEPTSPPTSDPGASPSPTETSDPGDGQ
jgi:serine/threonine protein kinase/beta-lactam-binding protein with PASTA domain